MVPRQLKLRIYYAIYGALIAACLAFWVLAFLAVSFKNQLIFSTRLSWRAFCCLSRRGAPVVPASQCGSPRCYVRVLSAAVFGFTISKPCRNEFRPRLPRRSHPVLVAKHSEGAKGIETRAAIATKSHRLPRWAAATRTSAWRLAFASMIAAYTLGSAVISTCTPCECTQEGVLTSCQDLPKRRVAETDSRLERSALYGSP